MDTNKIEILGAAAATHGHQKVLEQASDLTVAIIELTKTVHALAQEAALSPEREASVVATLKELVSQHAHLAKSLRDHAEKLSLDEPVVQEEQETAC
ncbi:hypothetical protein [Devosia aquimaris]|uniref:hypothetical protein n=1 Tax=Devosia aquimaris TaxID=2866214 RepID=UPI001CD17FA9|nr:hypothetical protein [Devosia sp. CJK-A8-3]